MSKIKSTIPTTTTSTTIPIINTQPREIFHPSEFIAIDDLEELLDKQEINGGFELLADTHIINVKKRDDGKYGKEHWNTTSIFDISNENTQILFVAKKEIIYKCFTANSIVISFLTDTYKDPIFLAMLKFSEKFDECCCKITTSTGKGIGFTKKNDEKNEGIGGFLLQNELEDKTYKISLVQFNGNSFVYDIWDGPVLVAGISSENLFVTIYTAGSLNSSTKIILLGFSFYLDGLTRGDEKKFHYF